MKELQVFTRSRKNQSTAETILEVIREMKSDISKTESKIVAMDRKLNDFTSEINNKFDRILSRMSIDNNYIQSSQNSPQRIRRPSSGSKTPNRPSSASDLYNNYERNRLNSGSRNTGMSYAVRDKIKNNSSPSGSRPVSASNPGSTLVPKSKMGQFRRPTIDNMKNSTYS